MRSCTTAALPLLLVAAVACGGGTGDAASSAGAAGADDEAPITIPLEPIPGVEVADDYTRRLYAGELDALFARFTDEFRSTFDRDQLQQLYDTMRERYGSEVSVVSLQRRESDGYRGFARFAIFDRYDGMVQIRWILREDDSIAGLSLQASPKTPLPADGS